jgi:hypothetical protein
MKCEVSGSHGGSCDDDILLGYPCILFEVDRRLRGAYCIIRAMMEAVRTSETSVCFNETT